VPSFANRTKLTVNINYTKIFEGFSVPKEEAMEQLSSQAIREINTYYKSLVQQGY